MMSNGLLICIAAKNALRRKKVHEKNLEQTTAQIVQLEQQIYSIEAANINQETLKAMEAAGAAMAKIHGSMTLDTVDQTMYVVSLRYHLSDGNTATDYGLGIHFANSTNSAPKSHKPLQAPIWSTNQTRPIWKRNSRAWSRRPWTSGCSTQVRCRLQTNSTVYLLRQMEKVSHCPSLFTMKLF